MSSAPKFGWRNSGFTGVGRRVPRGLPWPRCVCRGETSAWASTASSSPQGGPVRVPGALGGGGSVAGWESVAVSPKRRPGHAEALGARSGWGLGWARG
jgi:hypothetical protein